MAHMNNGLLTTSRGHYRGDAILNTLIQHESLELIQSYYHSLPATAAEAKNQFIPLALQYNRFDMARQLLDSGTPFNTLIVGGGINILIQALNSHTTSGTHESCIEENLNIFNLFKFFGITNYTDLTECVGVGFYEVNFRGALSEIKNIAITSSLNPSIAFGFTLNTEPHPTNNSFAVYRPTHEGAAASSATIEY